MDISVIEGKIKASSMSPRNKDLVIKYLQRDRGNPKIKKLGSTEFKAYYLIVIDSWYGHKDFDKITDDDFKKLIEQLKIQKPAKKSSKTTNKNFSEEGIMNCFVVHKAFMKWLYGSDKFNKEFIHGYYWEKDSEEEPLIFSFDEIDKILQAFDTKIEDLRKRGSLKLKMFMVYKTLFRLGTDSGLRPQELQHLRNKDLVWDADKNKYWVYCQFPKKTSEKRNIDVPYSTKEINEYLSFIKGNPEDSLFDITLYDAKVRLDNGKVVNHRFLDAPKDKDVLINVDKTMTKGTIQSLNKRAVKSCSLSATTAIGKIINQSGIKKNKKFTLYSMRHSSIQHYTELYQGNPVNLAKRYGWSFGSVGDRLVDYLARSKVLLPDAESMRREDLTRKSISEKEQEILDLKHQMIRMEKELAFIYGNISKHDLEPDEDLVQVLRYNPKALDEPQPTRAELKALDKVGKN